MSKYLKYVSQNGGVSFGFVDVPVKDKEETKPTNEPKPPIHNSVVASPIIVSDVLKVDPEFKNKLKFSALGDFVLAQKAFESFDDHYYSVEADMNLLRMASDRQRHYVATQTVGDLRVEEGDSIDDQLQNKINEYKRTLRENEKLKKGFEGVDVYSQESVLDNVIAFLKRILERIFAYIQKRRNNIQKYFNQVIDTYRHYEEEAKQQPNLQTVMKEKYENLKQRIRDNELKTASSILNEVGIGHVYALGYLLGDDYRQLKRYLSDPKMINQATMTLVKRFDQQLALRNTLNSTLSDVNYLAKSLIETDPSKVTEKHLNKYFDNLKRVFENIMDCLNRHGKKVSETEYHFAGFKHDEQFIIHIKQKNQYAFPTLSRNHDKEQEVDEIISTIVNGMDTASVESFIQACIDNPVKLQEGYKALSSTIKSMSRFKDIDIDTVNHIDALLKTKDAISKLLDADKFKVTEDVLVDFPEIKPLNVAPKLQASLKLIFQVAVETISFVMTMINYQNADATQASRAIESLIKFYVYSRK